MLKPHLYSVFCGVPSTLISTVTKFKIRGSPKIPLLYMRIYSLIFILKEKVLSALFLHTFIQHRTIFYTRHLLNEKPHFRLKPTIKQ